MLPLFLRTQRLHFFPILYRSFLPSFRFRRPSEIDRDRFSQLWGFEFYLIITINKKISTNSKRSMGRLTHEKLSSDHENGQTHRTTITYTFQVRKNKLTNPLTVQPMKTCRMKVYLLTKKAKLYIPLVFCSSFYLCDLRETVQRVVIQFLLVSSHDLETTYVFRNAILKKNIFRTFYVQTNMFSIKLVYM